jgi:hypothetical protein
MTLRGEWWICDGEVEFADQDVGDRGHESIAIGRLADKFLGMMDIYEDHAWNLSNHISEIREWLREEHSDRFTEGTIMADPLECAREVLAEENAANPRSSFPTAEQFEDAWFCACGCGNRDARKYMIQYEGWKRVKGNDVETWSLTAHDLKEITDGLWEIHSQESADDVPDDMEFHIEIRSTGKYYQGIPWKVLNEGDPMRVIHYEEVA